jgi:hypothetical protein
MEVGLGRNEGCSANGGKTQDMQGKIWLWHENNFYSCISNLMALIRADFLHGIRKYTKT